MTKQPAVLTVLLAVGAYMLGWGASPARAQSLFGNRGPSSQIGSNLTGSLVGQSTTLGSTLGGGLIGQPIAGSGTGSFGGLSPTSAAGGFVGRDDSTGRFVGDQRIGQQATGSWGGSSPGRQFSSFGNRAGGVAGSPFGRNAFASANSAQASRRTIRPRQEIAFRYPQRATSSLASQLTVRLATISQRQTGLQGVTVAVDPQGIATLTGLVSTEETKKLAAILVRLEPGVNRVSN